MVRISQAVFLLQEALLSCLYIYGAVQMMSPSTEIRVKRVMWELIAVSVFLIVQDVVILVLAYLNLHTPKEPVQNFAYALKLKMELFVLNQLLQVVTKNGNDAGGNRYRYGSHSRKREQSDTITTKQSLGLPIMSPTPSSNPQTWQSTSDDSDGKPMVSLSYFNH